MIYSFFACTYDAYDAYDVLICDTSVTFFLFSFSFSSPFLALHSPLLTTALHPEKSIPTPDLS